MSVRMGDDTVEDFDHQSRRLSEEVCLGGSKPDAIALERTSKAGPYIL